MEELETCPNEVLCVGVSDPEEGKAVIRYTYGDDEELAAYFFDREFSEKLWEYKMDGYHTAVSDLSMSLQPVLR